jgi:phosphatidylglycerol:prolipoprotein diacylglycerol transferase
MANTFEIFKIWEGGMSFHGGFLGALFMLYLYAKKAGISFIYLTDRIAPGACLGLMFGRIANFINGELWGTPTDLPWGIIFPNADMLTRHPSQLYEALFEGLVLFIILFYFAKRTNRQGLVSSLFLIGYGVFRFAIEYTRQADDIDFLHKGIFEYISMGQLLSLPMIIVGSAMLYHVWKKKKEIDNAIQNSLDKHYKNIDAEVEAKKARKRLSTKRSK